jgi:hypothetical protein
LGSRVMLLANLDLVSPHHKLVNGSQGVLLRWSDHKRDQEELQEARKSFAARFQAMDDEVKPVGSFTFLPSFFPSFLLSFLPAFLPSSLPACLSVYVPVCLPTCLSTCLPVYLPACLPAYTVHLGGFQRFWGFSLGVCFSRICPQKP